MPVTKDDVATLQDLLVQFGDLTKVDRPGQNPTYSYENQSGRAGLGKTRYGMPGVGVTIQPVRTSS